MEKYISKEDKNMVNMIEQVIEKDRIRFNKENKWLKERNLKLKKMRADIEAGKPVDQNEIAEIRNSLIKSGIVDENMKLTKEYRS